MLRGMLLGKSANPVKDWHVPGMASPGDHCLGRRGGWVLASWLSEVKI